MRNNSILFILLLIGVTILFYRFRLNKSADDPFPDRWGYYAPTGSIESAPHSTSFSLPAVAMQSVAQHQSHYSSRPTPSTPATYLPATPMPMAYNSLPIYNTTVLSRTSSHTLHSYGSTASAGATRSYSSSKTYSRSTPTISTGNISLSMPTLALNSTLSSKRSQLYKQESLSISSVTSTALHRRSYGTGDEEEEEEEDYSPIGRAGSYDGERIEYDGTWYTWLLGTWHPDTIEPGEDTPSAPLDDALPIMLLFISAYAIHRKTKTSTGNNRIKFKDLKI